MRRTVLTILTAITAGASFAQMTGGSMSTSNYFPLVDGARYDYVFASGPRASATAVMHAGQTWGGISQLTEMHLTAVCRPALPCTQDSTDFYRMDPDGMRFFGGTSETRDGDHYTMMYASPEWILKNPVWPGTMMGSGMYQGAEMWQAPVSMMNSLQGPQAYMSSYQAEALETVTTPMGMFSNALHVREQRGSGSVRDVWYAAGVGMVRWVDGDEEALLAAVTLPNGPVPALRMAIEYYDADLDHYFMTADPAEIGALDAGRFPGWQRTGLSFNVVDPAAGGPAAAPVCRYYGNPADGLDTHFYSASPNECAAVHQQWPDQWLLESSNVFEVYLPDVATGTCPDGTIPIYRAWNGQADTNHRYTTDFRIQTTMMGRGYLPEGYGNPSVVMCSPQ